MLFILWFDRRKGTSFALVVHQYSFSGANFVKFNSSFTKQAVKKPTIQRWYNRELSLNCTTKLLDEHTTHHGTKPSGTTAAPNGPFRRRNHSKGHHPQNPGVVLYRVAAPCRIIALSLTIGLMAALHTKFITKPTYSASYQLFFEEEGGGMSGAMRLASSFGFSLGEAVGATSSINVQEYLSSRDNIAKTGIFGSVITGFVLVLFFTGRVEAKNIMD
jgi:hypothetical protein